MALAIVLSVLAATFVSPTPQAADAAEVRLITLPVHADRVDDVYWSDTWGAARSGGRSHIGVDMMGEKMVPLVAVRSATVTWGRFDNDRGSILRLRDDEGWEYQYIHLNNDTPGTDDGQASCNQTFSDHLCAAIVDDRFASGTRVTEGDIIGYMGDGGNAENTRPHLHFEIYKPVGNGTEPINPAPSVDAALDRLLQSPSAAGSEPAYAQPGDSGFADYLWFKINGRYPSASERAEFEAEVDSVGLWQALGERVDEDSVAAMIDRLYLAFFLRYPDTDGIEYWIRVRGSGWSAEAIAEWFADSEEFELRYGGTDFGQFIDQLYQDVLGRPSDEAGKQYWLDRLQQGEVTRGTIVVYFTESAEMRGLTGRRNEIVALTLLREGQVPSSADLDGWIQLRSSQPIETALATWYSQ